VRKRARLCRSHWLQGAMLGSFAASPYSMHSLEPSVYVVI